MLCGFGTNGSVESGIAIWHQCRVGLSELHITRVTLRQSEKVEGEIDTVDPLPHRGDLERIARIPAATDIENGCKAVAVVASHPDDRSYDRTSRKVPLDSARQNVSALALVIFTAERHR